MINTACAGDLWAVKVTVVDEGGRPIEDADVLLTFLLSEGANQYAGVTTEKGVVTAIRRGALQLIVEATKEGYYETFFKGSQGSQEVIVVLREQKNPIPMYAKKSRLWKGKNDFEGKWVGYDLIASDYVPPYGKGLYADFEFNTNYDKQDMWNYRFDLSVRFPNEGDGLLPYKVKDYTSKLKSDYIAPDSGYERFLKYFEYRAGSDMAPDTNLDRSRKYYFRVRTKLDEDGDVISALYGKLYGEFPDLNYYLNPNENDRNIEFDPKQNLFLKLPPEERQFEP
jgi:hypothetical protein